MAASANDGATAPEVARRLTGKQRPRLELIWADGKYGHHHLGERLAEAGAGYSIEEIDRPPRREGFARLPRRWVVERAFAWPGRYRRSYDLRSRSSQAMIRISSIHRMIRGLRPDRSKKAVPSK